MPHEQQRGSAGSAHVERLLGESLCTALGWSTIVVVRALFFSPNKLFLQIKNEKSSSSHSSFFMLFIKWCQSKGLHLDGGSRKLPCSCGCQLMGMCWGYLGERSNAGRIARGNQNMSEQVASSPRSFLMQMGNGLQYLQALWEWGCGTRLERS